MATATTLALPEYQLLINGQTRAAASGETFFTVNPPEAPFGGYKQSGVGRELSRHAMACYTQVKNVVVNLNPEPFDWYGRWPEAPKP
jgi:hypothetical protein